MQDYVFNKPGVMRLASPVWKAMLTGGFAESRKAVISLEDDDPDALLIVLLAAHLQHRQLPKELTFDQIVKLAVICDKYDTATVVQPFLHQWNSPYQSNCLEAGHEQWLSVAWAFGYTENFKDIADCLVRTSMIDSEGRCLNIEGKLTDIGKRLAISSSGTRNKLNLSVFYLAF